MTAKKILLAGVLGGVAMFLWSFVAHMFTPLATAGMSEFPIQQSITTEMHKTLGDHAGFYIFPGFGLGADATDEQKRDAMKNMQARLDANPSGMLIYHPPGRKAMTPGQLGTEFATEVFESLVIAFLISLTTLTTFGSRVGMAAVLGVLASVTTNVPYWNWYGFPKRYTAAYMTIEVVAYIVAGILIALIAGKGSAKTRATAA